MLRLADFSVMSQELLITRIPFAKHKSFISYNSAAVTKRQKDINYNKKRQEGNKKKLQTYPIFRVTCLWAVKYDFVWLHS